MAKLVLEMDTVSKEFSLKLDNQVLSDVYQVVAYKKTYDANGQDLEDGQDCCSIEIMRRTEDKDNGIVMYERTIALDKDVEIKREKKENKSLYEDIAKFMKNMK